MTLESVACTTTFQVCAFAYKFTGKERDQESGLDYFGARYYASNMGRWMSPDWSASPTPVPYASLQNPQSLNLYGYVNNNPLSRADADGPFWRELLNELRTGCACWTRDFGTAQLRANSNYMANTPTRVLLQRGQQEGERRFVVTSRIMAGFLVPGESMGAGEAGEAVGEAGNTLLNKSLASQQQMGELSSGKGNAMAGAGKDIPIRDINRLVSQYGGEEGDWAKVTSSHYSPNGSEEAPGGFGTHAYQNVKTGQVVEMKSNVDTMRFNIKE
jgi:RHS repeat-associated protein